MIEVALATDAHYICGLLVTAVSMARYADPEADIRFNILDGGIPDAAWADFEAKVRSAHPKSAFLRIPVDDARFSAFPEWNGKSRLTYARLLLPQTLPDAEQVIYCDVDFLWRADIAELWKLRDAQVILQSVRDGTDDTRLLEEPWFSARRLVYSPDCYFCAGLAIFNLRLFRELDVAGRVLSFLDAHTDVQFVDQSALNAVLGGDPLAEGVENIRMLPTKWQRLSRFVTADDLRTGCAIHYAGDTPWGQGCRLQPLTDLQLLWHDCYGELIGGGRSASLQRFFSPGTIRFRRLMFTLVSRPVSRGLFFLVLRLVGRGGYIPWFRSLGGYVCRCS